MKRYDIPILCTYLLLISIFAVIHWSQSSKITQSYNQMVELLSNQDIKVIDVRTFDRTIYVTEVDEVTQYPTKNSAWIRAKLNRPLPKITHWRPIGYLSGDLIECMEVTADTLHIMGRKGVKSLQLQIDKSIKIVSDDEAGIRYVNK